MRGNLPKREPEILARWQEIDLYRRLQERRADAPPFVLHDGPPYANGNIHLGTTLNKVLKDVIVKFRAMNGSRAPYVPGWDCHGLPIELQVERTLGKKQGVSKPEFRRMCREYAERYVGIQRDEFRRLGVVGDWDRPYLTMDAGYEAAEVREFGKLLEQGAVYRGKKPVLWCASCVTALAEAEVEYADLVSPSIYVAFPLDAPLPAPLAQFGSLSPAIVIWTTTPWTLPANLAIALHPEFEYLLVEDRGRAWVVARDLLEPFSKAVGLSDAAETRARFRGRELDGARARHPWIDRESRIVLGEHVTLEAGTGSVHTAPGHGQEDYEVGLRYGLDPYAPVDDRGRFTADVEGFAGRFVFEADPAIVDLLKNRGALLGAERASHSYPHCWRCKNPVIFRATEQWFISMEKGGLRQRVLDEIERVRWIPEWGRERIRGMMEFRPDWCISRQRSWGVPIVAFYCEGCGETLANRAVTDHVAAIFAKEGSDAWFIRPVEALVPPGASCAKCSGKSFRREEDILDVWFDSGMSHAAVLEERAELGSPADLYLEGSDQHRGWFHSSLLTSVLVRGRAPYRAVLTHGFVIDLEGRKMSKSAGNAMTPQEILGKHGAEILRLWVAAEDYRDEVRISQEIIGRLVESFRRIRNTARFLLANLYDFDPARDAVGEADLLELDRWILDRTRRLEVRCRASFEAYEFHVVYHALNNFCSVDLSALYLDIVKDRLYCSRTAGPERRAAQTALWRILGSLVRLMAPVLTFTAEDVWAYVPTIGEKAPSILLTDFPRGDDGPLDDALAATWERLLAVRGAVTKALEEERKAGRIGHSLDACVRIGFAAGSDLEALLAGRLADLPALFIVSQVERDDALPASADSELVPGLRIGVGRAAGEKCGRCWNYRTSVGRSEAHPQLCAPCVAVLEDGR